MSFAAAFPAIDAALSLPAAMAGGLYPWAYCVLALTGIGAAAYVAVGPGRQCLAGYRARLARRRIGRALEPERRYRRLSDRLAVCDTIADRAALANACCDLELFEEARRHYQNILARPHGAQPMFMEGKARAEYGLGLDDQAAMTLDVLRARWPHHRSRDLRRLCAHSAKMGKSRPVGAPFPKRYFGEAS
ncbi:hypothetical protein RA307_07255 [Xanthobacteraceae bacterium Astr-EGSB]|uniref:hypothetical protein n=1 Tax=Astrobacterium formosum TaxID=3069710 RepID=UPI0027B7E5AA|nr:hypothetical protein [Xanthobacteraceae bacterium Astr-EGSB]